MKAIVLALCLSMALAPWSSASQAQATAPKEAAPAAASGTSEEQELLSLSRQKWLWMSERNVDALAALFHEKAVFVHMGGTMSRDQELDVIRSGGIHYKDVEIQEASVRLIGKATAIRSRSPMNGDAKRLLP